MKSTGINIKAYLLTTFGIECLLDVYKRQGFQSAVDIATNTIDCIHTTAASHSRVFIVELMGHKTGWLTLHAGIAGGSDVILIPEIPYDLDKVVEAINKRINDKKHFTILAVAEGIISKEEMLYSKKELKEVRKKEHYPSAAYRIDVYKRQVYNCICNIKLYYVT